MPDSLQFLGLQPTNLPCPSLSPRVCSNSCPLNRRCHQPPYSLLHPSLPALNLSQHQGLSQSQCFTWGGPITGPSASTSVLPVDIQGWFPLGWTSLISLQSTGLSRVFSSTTVQRHQIFGTQSSLWSNSHICTWLLEKQ